MADKVTVSGPIEMEHASVESVAFKLMSLIASQSSTHPETADRKYWLKLYSQCLKATKGYDLEQVLQET